MENAYKTVLWFIVLGSTGTVKGYDNTGSFGDVVATEIGAKIEKIGSKKRSRTEEAERTEKIGRLKNKLATERMRHMNLMRNIDADLLHWEKKVKRTVQVRAETKEQYEKLEVPKRCTTIISKSSYYTCD